MTDVMRLRYRFEDVNALTEAIGGWDCELVQLSRGSLDLRWEGVAAADFTVSMMSHQARTAERFVVSPGRIAFALSLTPCEHHCGVEVPSATLAMLFGGREHRARMNGYHGVELLFEEAAVASHRFGRRLLAARRGPDELVFPLTRNQAAALVRAAEALLDDHTVLQPPLASDAARGRLLDLIGAAIGPRLDSGLAPKLRRVRGYNLARDALGLVDEMGHEIAVADVIERLEVTRRALELSFRSAFGVSPGQYLLARRLTRARRGLLARAGSVGEIATDTGFNDLSRFARHYARLYGELPSGTLARIAKA